MSYKDRLKKIGKEWKNARPQGGGSVPAGSYQAKIEKVYLKERNDHLFLNFQFTIVTGECSGRKAFRNIDLDYVNKNGEHVGLGWLKKDFETLGVECDDVSQIEEVAKDILDLVCEINVTINAKGYPNTYINKLIHAPESAIEDDEDEEEEAEEEEEKPAPKKKAKAKSKKKEPEPETDDDDDEWDDEWDDDE